MGRSKQKNTQTIQKPLGDYLENYPEVIEGLPGLSLGAGRILPERPRSIPMQPEEFWLDFRDPHGLKKQANGGASYLDSSQSSPSGCRFRKEALDGVFALFTPHFSGQPKMLEMAFSAAVEANNGGWTFH